MNKGLRFLVFALVGVAAYALFAGLNIDLNPGRGVDPEGVQFTWWKVPIWAVVGGIIGLLPTPKRDRDQD